MADSPELRAHKEWIGYLQPVGLVVSPPALLAAQAHVDRNIIPQQQVLLRLTGKEGDQRVVADLPALCVELLGWEKSDLAGAPGGPEVPDSLAVVLPEYGEVLKPIYAVPDPDRPDAWLMLIQTVGTGADLDRAPAGDERQWQASPQARFERLLRETGIAIGVLSNGIRLRLVYAPRGESSGNITFPVAAMCEVAGRPILSALHMLLGAERLFSLPTGKRLPAILRESRKYQNEVSTELAEQVLSGLHDLLRGFQAANEASQGVLFRDVLREAPSEVYGGLLSTILRLVFILYAEDRGLLPTDPVYVGHYSVTGLFQRLRDDAARYPDTVDQRYGAWPQLLTLFRLIHDGGVHGRMRLPPRHGKLFDPDAYPFLEGRPFRTRRVMGDRITPPRVADGAIYRVLQNLLVLRGDRLSYRALDVEQIGSVYEAMMGFELRVATGASIAVQPDHVVVSLEDLLEAPGGERAKRLKEWARCELSGQALERLKSAAGAEELVAALGRRVSSRTPNVLLAGAMYLQPTEERRRSGSHYTPRSLTEPIVRTTLRPIFEALGERPRPEQILELKVCDPAMGSGAFLVEACRFLGDALVAAWRTHDAMPPIPPDEDPVLHARRLIAHRCLYGIDKNPFAVDLAKLSLWLATLARDHPFTFLDHALRHGDSLVGLTREQIASFHWEPEKQLPLVRDLIDRAVRRAEDLRVQIHALADSDDTHEKIRLLRDADDALADVRLVGDLVIAAFFSEYKDKVREQRRKAYGDKVEAWLAGKSSRVELQTIADELREGKKPVPAFHWEIEFPEVFLRDLSGFDAVTGNPPFLGGKRISTLLGISYRDWLPTLHRGANSNSDLVAHFFRRAFGELRESGTLGLIATNTIAQGDTRASGLYWICTHGGTIYAARKRVSWPGKAAVIVSVIHVARGFLAPPHQLDGRGVPRITAFLFHAGGDEEPARLLENGNKSFIGSYVLGLGFMFDDEDSSATPIAEMRRLIAQDPRNRDRIFPYLGGEDVNDSSTHAHRRYVINFGEMSEAEARRWPDLMAIVEAKVRPERLTKNREAYRRNWWQYAEKHAELYRAMVGLERVLIVARVSKTCAFTFVTTGQVLNEKIVVFPFDRCGLFGLLQSRVHETWARFFSATLKDDLQYTPTDCFETFPFPHDWQSSAELERVGQAYYQFRADLMVKNNQGLTATYNRFHDPDESGPEILELRRLHAVMDWKVIDAYGWADIRPTYEFLLDYEDDEDPDDEGPRRRKKPWRYRWPDGTRDEVLARLLALNRERAQQEKLAGLPSGVEGKSGRGKARRGRRRDGDHTLFA
jgi:hypothetical protein